MNKNYHSLAQNGIDMNVVECDCELIVCNMTRGRLGVAG